MTAGSSIPRGPATAHVADSSSSSGFFPGGVADPLNAPQEIAGAAGGVVGGAISSGVGAAASGVWAAVEPFLATALFVVFGLGLMALGAYKIASPAAKRGEEAVQPIVEDAGKAAAAGAVVGG